MAKSVKKGIREEYNRLKKVLEKLLKPKKNQQIPSLVLQPVKDKKNYRSN